MYKVRNREDARIGYMLLKGVRERFDDNDGYADARSELIIELKRELRKYSHRDVEGGIRIVKDYGIDGFIALERLPDGFKSKSAARKWYGMNCTYEYVPSMYDCTGQWFTNWFKVFKRNGEWWCYHSVSVDV